MNINGNPFMPLLLLLVRVDHPWLQHRAVLPAFVHLAAEHGHLLVAGLQA